LMDAATNRHAAVVNNRKGFFMRSSDKKVGAIPIAAVFHDKINKTLL
jgi:hypothetical protein